MKNYPRTIEEAKAYRYNKRGTCFTELEYKMGKCAYEIRSLSYYQCTRSNGHGPDGLYCKTHAKKVEG